MRDPRLLMVFPPRHDARTRFVTLAEGLSERYRGTILTASEDPLDIEIGRFRVIAVPRDWTRRNEASARMLRAGYEVVRHAARNHDPIDLVTAYDPLRTGAIASSLRFLARSKLVIELNGDYATPVNYATEKNPILRSLKRRASIGMQQLILRQANGAKPLHLGLMNGSERPTLAVESFHDLVDLERFDDRGEQPVILFAGFPFYLKGVDLLIDAFKRVCDAHPEWSLKILGFYPDPSELNAHIANHPRIAHHPPVDPSEMPEHIGRCGIFALPSRSEAMGRVLLEAAAAHKPRVGSRVGGIPKVISHEHDGLLFDSGDVVQLATCLDRLMSNAELRKRLGAAAAARVHEEFSVTRYFERTFEFYDRVLKFDRA
ncbi:MAG: glycosyltransferase family 4 protein [Myxococcota bacterium]